MAVKCDRCGVETEISESFFKKRKAFSSNIRTLCPLCQSKSEVSTLKWIFLSNFAVGGLGVIYLLLLPAEGIGWYLINLFFFEIFLALTILPHELGHAFAARLMGLRVFKLFIGFGQPIFTKNLFGFETEFRVIPLGGVTLAAHQDKNRFRLKQLGYIFAGPLVSLLLGLSVLFFVPFQELWHFGKIEHGLALGQVFFFANLFILAITLWPHQVLTPAGKISSDGKLLWETLFLKQKTKDDNHAARFALEGMTFHRKGQIAEALIWIEKGRELYPDNVLLLNLFGIILLESKQYEKARDCFVKILAHADNTPVVRGLFLNNIAYVDALLGDSNLLTEADDYSQKALAILGWHPSIRGTRGTVLLGLGNVEQAIPLLRGAMNEHDTASNKAQNACFISIAEAQRGNLTESKKYLDEAGRLMPTCFLLERTETAFRNAVAKASAT